MKSTKSVNTKQSFLFLAMLLLSSGIIACGSNDDNRFGSRGSVSGIPELLSKDSKCYKITRSGNGSIEFDFSSYYGISENHWITYVSDGYSTDGNEEIETNDHGVEIRIYEKHEKREDSYYNSNSLVLLSGYVYIPDRVVDFIMHDIGEDIDEDELCIYGLRFYSQEIYLDVRDNNNYSSGLSQILLID